LLIVILTSSLKLLTQHEAGQASEAGNNKTGRLIRETVVFYRGILYYALIRVSQSAVLSLHLLKYIEWSYLLVSLLASQLSLQVLEVHGIIFADMKCREILFSCALHII